MGRSIQDILDSNKQEDIESVEGWKESSKRNSIDLSFHWLNSLIGIENLPNAYKIVILHLDHNRLNSLIGIEKLPALNTIYFPVNPCFERYRKLNGKDISTSSEIIKYIKDVECHLNKTDILRGVASVIDTGLFDFKIK